MKKKKVLIFLIVAMFVGFANSATLKIPGDKIMDVSGAEMRALAGAYNFAKSAKIDVNKYRIFLTEEEDAYMISFIDTEKPAGFRGSRAGYPQPNLKIDKHSGAIIEQHFSR